MNPCNTNLNKLSIDLLFFFWFAGRVILNKIHELDENKGIDGLLYPEIGVMFQICRIESFDSMSSMVVVMLCKCIQKRI